MMKTEGTRVNASMGVSNLSNIMDAASVIKKTAFVSKKQFLYVDAWNPPTSTRRLTNMMINRIPAKSFPTRVEINRIENAARAVENSNSAP
jgi:hypothetical protein